MSCTYTSWKSLRPMGAVLVAALSVAFVACGDDAGDGNINVNTNNNNGETVSCGDGEIDGLEECDDGADNSDTRADACRTDCTEARCGDGVSDTAESCDDGRANSDEVPDACRSDCTLATCGDYVVDVQAGESCDYGPDVAGDFCDADCQVIIVFCGNGLLEADEVCDDGNNVSGDGCSANCLSLEICGNGIPDFAAGEECDDGNSADDDECHGDCRLPVCGDGIVDAQHSEVCDDGGNVSGDGCSANCLSLEICGDGTLDWGEQCDDGNTVDGDNCHADCSIPFCGDGIADPALFESCDAGINNSDTADATCRPNCQLQRCGDGITDPLHGEVCDDGNLDALDGCTPDCLSDETCANDYVDFLTGEQCDDGDRLSGDGCSSLCNLESPVWVEAQTGVPSPRLGHAMAYDPARGKLVLFGGADPTYTPLGDTWEWDGSGWTRISPPLSPPPRYDHAMVYDAARGKVVLFGGDGTGSNQVLDDTWEWDGTNWTQRYPSGSPAARSDHAMAYDPVRERVVLFAGWDGYNFGWYDDTWEWDGADWIQLTPAQHPGQLESHAMAYDVARGKVVLFGGTDLSGSPYTADTWEWDGTNWTLLNPAQSPPVRKGHSLVYAAAQGVVVLYGGRSGVGVLGDGWQWDGTNWTPISAALSPGRRQYHAGAYDTVSGEVILFGGGGVSDTFLGDTWGWDGGTDWSARSASVSLSTRRDSAMAYDAVRARVVLFGGADDTNDFLADTWEWNGSAWMLQSPAASPAFRKNHAMVYDVASDKTVLFGGYNLSQAFSDTWEWNGVDWTERATVVQPAARYGHTMVYDDLRSRTVLFGGEDFGVGGFADDTWEWDGTTWTDVTPSSTPSPPGRNWHAMAFDAFRGVVVLFGGRHLFDYRQDTWEWDGTQWTDVSPSVSPPGRHNHQMVYDPNRRRVVLFGGSSGAVSYLDDTWEWDGVTWRQLAPALAPSPRGYFAMTFDRARSEMVLFGGDDSSAVLGDTWRYRYSGLLPNESCLHGADRDADGLLGCADPDCWGYCTPLCPPGMVGCDPTAVRCGDGVCSPERETCRLCPADCGVCPAVCGDFQCDPGENNATCAADCP